MSDTIEIAEDFASMMQRLSAQAERVAAGENSANLTGGQLTQLLYGFRGLDERMQRLENLLVKKFEQLEQTSASTKPETSEQFQKLDEQLAAIRNSESVNHKLFDSLHQELIGYRDNFLHDSLQKPFIRDLMVLFDDLSGISSQMEKAAQSEPIASPASHARDNLRNSLHFLLEIMHRLEVNEIETMDRVDLALHRVVSYEPADFAEDDGRIVARVKRGFRWRDAILRPEEVIAKRFE